MISPAARAALSEALGERIRFEVPMARLTSLGVGGPADAVAIPEDRTELARLLRICHRYRTPHHVIGTGFNTLALDGPLTGVVVRLSRFRRIEERPNGALRAEAGVSHSQVTRFCVDRGLSGLEFGCGIPGSVGGWIAMNAGVPAREVEGVLIEVEAMSPSGRRIRHLLREDLRFVYRALRGLAPGTVLLSGLFRVSPTPPARVRAEVDGLLAQRAKTQPIDVPSCGSVFKNPPGDFAGRLIEAAGLKGHRVGGAQISPVHANFIANLGGADAADVTTLIREAQKRVHEQTGKRLVPEVHIVGSRA